MSEIPPDGPPPSYVQYPRYNPQQPPSGYAPKTIDIGVIGQAWSMVQANLVTWMGATFALFVVMAFVVAVPLILMLATNPIFSGNFKQPPDPTAMIGAQLGTYGIQIVASLIQQVLMVGLMNMGLKQSKGQPIAISDAFAFGGRLGSVVGLVILIQVCYLLGLLACCVGIFVAIGLTMFAVPLFLDRRFSPVAAITESYEMLKQQWIMATLAMFVFNFIGTIGIYACGVGILVSQPILVMCVVLNYRRFVPYDPATSMTPTVS
jgi:uncharacterized membrane protein